MINYRFLTTETSLRALYLYHCLFTTSSVKLFVVNVHIFVYICFFRKKKKQHSQNLSHFENESTFRKTNIFWKWKNYLSPLWTHWLWKPHLKNSKFDLWQLSFCIFLHKVFFFTLIRNLCTYMAEGTVIAVLYSKLMQIFHFSKNTYPFNMLRVLVLHYNLLINSKQPNV